MSRKYYAADNSYGSETSIGFSNTWGVCAFSNKKDRDNYVSRGDLSTRAIKKTEIKDYFEESPQPFSIERFIIETRYDCDDPGLIGYVEIAVPEMGMIPLYK
jgi:hypothetical protein